MKLNEYIPVLLNGEMTKLKMFIPNRSTHLNLNYQGRNVVLPSEDEISDLWYDVNEYIEEVHQLGVKTLAEVEIPEKGMELIKHTIFKYELYDVDENIAMTLYVDGDEIDIYRKDMNRFENILNEAINEARYID